MRGTFARKGTLFRENWYMKGQGVVPRGGVSSYKNLLSTPSGERSLKRQVISALTNYFTDIGMNCHIRLCVVSGLEVTLPDCLQHVVLYSVSFLSLLFFLFQFFVLYVISASPFQKIFIATSYSPSI